MEIPQLTSYQQGVLCYTAKGQAPIFLMARPRRDDKATQMYRLRENRKEVEQLVVLGLMENVTNEFRESIREHEQRTHRKYYVYGLTKEGYLLFQDCEVRSIN